MSSTKENKFNDYKPLDIDKDKIIELSNDFLQTMQKRRTVRTFSDEPVPYEVIENIIKTAASAPSGANKQPWMFCVISNSDLKKKIREAVEGVEKESYQNRMSAEWLSDLEKFKTNWQKPCLDTAPYLIVIFKKVYDLSSGEKKTNYYVNESVGIALGFLITAVHQAGLVCVTHTPSPMNFLAKLLNRPANERTFMLLPVGFPKKNSQVPDITKKKIKDILVHYNET